MLKIHYAAFRDTMAVLQTSDFTRTNVRYAVGAPGGVEPLGADFPDGQLGGQVVVHTGSYEIGVMSTAVGVGTTVPPVDETPIGLFINDAAGSPYENTPAVASGKSPFVSGSGSVVEVDIFESNDSGGDALPAYMAGDLLFGSANGLVTKEILGHPGVDAVVRVGWRALGTCYRVPGTSGLLGVRLL